RDPLVTGVQTCALPIYALPLGHNAFRAFSPAIVEEVVAIPTRPGAGSHLRQPRPDVAPRATNSDRVGKGSDRFRNHLIAGQELRWLAVLHGRVRCSLAVTGGVATPDDGIKAILAGAHAVQMVSAILR